MAVVSFLALAFSLMPNERFEKNGTYSVTSTEGYSVELEHQRGVVYRDAERTVVIGHSWLGRPSGISLHPSTLRAIGLDAAVVDAITARTANALQYLGYYVEVF